MPTSKPLDKAGDLSGYEVLVAVCGGIAAYKVCTVVSKLVQSGAGVTVAMTRAARKFVGVATFQALSGRPVLKSLWQPAATTDVKHISATDAADLLLVAPATANMIGKIAAGIGDEVVSTQVLSASSPVLLAPSMNGRMWANLAVQANVATLRERGLVLLGPGEGWLACRHHGIGRMVEPEQIVDAVIEKMRENPPKRVDAGG